MWDLLTHIYRNTNKDAEAIRRTGTQMLSVTIVVKRSIFRKIDDI
jgi:hypothetical protein